MLDIRLLREEPEIVRQTLLDRGVLPFESDSPEAQELTRDDVRAAERARLAVAKLIELDDEHRSRLQEIEALRGRQNSNAEAMKSVGALPREEQAAKRASLIEEGRQMKEQARALEEAALAAEAARDRAWSRVPNLTHPDVPRGGEDVSAQISTWGQIRDFDKEGFAPRDHLDLALDLDLVDFESGAKVASSKFYYLKREAVLLDLALQRFALGVAQKHGFVLHTTPDLARAEILSGLGFNPRGASTQVYSVANTDLCLVGTAEITLGGLLADTILENDQLPLLMCGLSHCFRTEAGSAGQESRGLYRVHQFTKVELFAFVAGELSVSEAMHAKFLAIEEEIFQTLGLPYRVLDIASGDLGGPAYRKFDIETWMPGRGGYGEVTSTSNCTDYQARRLKIRYRPAASEGGKSKPRHVHMLNGTAVATSRAIVAILENYQRADGSVDVPEVLRPWVGCDRITKQR